MNIISQTTKKSAQGICWLVKRAQETMLKTPFSGHQADMGFPFPHYRKADICTSHIHLVLSLEMSHHNVISSDIVDLYDHTAIDGREE